ncbi:pentapeptide repeat-containing protein [Nannocystis exedens]|uniref:pentapeptide repeat-containing protein n=1 Tax=Nannocystis exedens TaxID=54 RepID=UPI00147544E8|nr:pentapeptide repeat-containing protein [Nannocystis exedens]
MLAPLACDDATADRDDASAIDLRDGGACPCDGGVDHLGNPVSTDVCGQQVCGEDFQYYACGPTGWVAQGGVCGGDDGCDCPGGTDHLGNPVHATTCGQQVCGEDFQYYACGQTGWVAQGGVCGGGDDAGDDDCDCPGGTDHLGNAVHATVCGQQICGEDFQYYACGQDGWVAQGGVCGGDDGCDCPGGTDHLGNAVHATSCGQQVCGEDLQYYACGQDGWVAQGGVCGGDGGGGLVFTTPAQLQSALDNGVDVRGATITFPFAMNVTMKDFRDVHFAGGVDGGWFFGTELDGAVFSGLVRRAPFLYADLDGADFSGATLDRCDFAFTVNADTATWPAANAITRTVWTGSGSRSAAMLPHTRLDTLVAPATLDALLAGGLVSDGMLGSSWRSYLYDSYLACVGGGTSKYFHLKSYVFDAVDGRYSGGSYVSPAGGPTLAFMHDLDYENNATPEFAGYIDRALADLIASNEAAYLDDPFGGRVSWSSERGVVDALADLYASPEAWYAALFNYAVQWNTPTASRNAAEIALAPDTIAATLATLGGAARQQFINLAADRLFSMEDLVGDPYRATIVAAIHAVLRARPAGAMPCPHL